MSNLFETYADAIKFYSDIFEIPVQTVQEVANRVGPLKCVDPHDLDEDHFEFVCDELIELSPNWS